MSFIKETRGDVLLITIVLKRATVIETDEFRELLLNCVNDGRKKIVVDLSLCSYMDSTFLGSLVIGLKASIKSGGDIRIAGANGDSQSILELTGTSRVFKSYTNLDEAIDSYLVK